MSTRRVGLRPVVRAPSRLEVTFTQNRRRARARRGGSGPAVRSSVRTELPRWDRVAAVALPGRHRVSDEGRTVSLGESEERHGMWVVPAAVPFVGTDRCRFRVTFSEPATYVSSGLITADERGRVHTQDFGTDFRRYSGLNENIGTRILDYDINMRRRRALITAGEEIWQRRRSRSRLRDINVRPALLCSRQAERHASSSVCRRASIWPAP